MNLSLKMNFMKKTILKNKSIKTHHRHSDKKVYNLNDNKAHNNQNVNNNLNNNNNSDK